MSPGVPTPGVPSPGAPGVPTPGVPTPGALPLDVQLAQLRRRYDAACRDLGDTDFLIRRNERALGDLEDKRETLRTLLDVLHDEAHALQVAERERAFLGAVRRVETMSPMDVATLHETIFPEPTDGTARKPGPRAPVSGRSPEAAAEVAP